MCAQHILSALDILLLGLTYTYNSKPPRFGMLNDRLNDCRSLRLLLQWLQYVAQALQQRERTFQVLSGLRTRTLPYSTLPCHSFQGRSRPSEQSNARENETVALGVRMSFIPAAVQHKLWLAC